MDGSNSADSNQAWWQQERHLRNFPKYLLMTFQAFWVSWTYDDERRQQAMVMDNHFYDPERCVSNFHHIH